jgi:hypothetical protein
MWGYSAVPRRGYLDTSDPADGPDGLLYTRFAACTAGDAVNTRNRAAAHRGTLFTLDYANENVAPRP